MHAGGHSPLGSRPWRLASLALPAPKNPTGFWTSAVHGRCPGGRPEGVLSINLRSALKRNPRIFPPAQACCGPFRAPRFGSLTRSECPSSAGEAAQGPPGGAFSALRIVLAFLPVVPTSAPGGRPPFQVRPYTGPAGWIALPWAFAKAQYGPVGPLWSSGGLAGALSSLSRSEPGVDVRSRQTRTAGLEAACGGKKAWS